MTRPTWRRLRSRRRDPEPVGQERVERARSAYRAPIGVSSGRPRRSTTASTLRRPWISARRRPSTAPAPRLSRRSDQAAAAPPRRPGDGALATSRRPRRRWSRGRAFRRGGNGATDARRHDDDAPASAPRRCDGGRAEVADKGRRTGGARAPRPRPRPRFAPPPRPRRWRARRWRDPRRRRRR